VARQTVPDAPDADVLVLRFASHKTLRGRTGVSHGRPTGGSGEFSTCLSADPARDRLRDSVRAAIITTIGSGDEDVGCLAQMTPTVGAGSC